MLMGSGWLHTYMHACTLTSESWNGLEWWLHAYMHTRTLTSESWKRLERVVTHIHARTHTHFGIVTQFGVGDNTHTWTHAQSWNNLKQMVTHIHAHTCTHAHTLTSESWNGFDRIVTLPRSMASWKPRRDPQSLQLLVCVACQLKPAQVLRLFGHRVQSGYLGSKQRNG